MIDVLYEKIWERMSADGRGDRLFGAGFSHAYDALKNFSAPDAEPPGLIEIPLTGKPGYDILVGPMNEKCSPKVSEEAAEFNEYAVKAVRWQKEHPEFGSDLYFELDGSAAKGTAAGVLLKHYGNLDAVKSFLQAMGKEKYEKTYLDVCSRLPKGWEPWYLMFFFGRNEEAVKLEVFPADKVITRWREKGSVAEEFKAGFDAIGFKYYNEQMLDEAQKLIDISDDVSFQFDIYPDGSYKPVFGMPIMFEHLTPGFSKQFEKDGKIGKVFESFKEFGIADERADLIKDACFTGKTDFKLSDDETTRLIMLCLPDTIKVKWNDGKMMLGKFYFMIRALSR